MSGNLNEDGIVALKGFISDLRSKALNEEHLSETLHLQREADPEIRPLTREGYIAGVVDSIDWDIEEIAEKWLGWLTRMGEH